MNIYICSSVFFAERGVSPAGGELELQILSSVKNDVPTNVANRTIQPVRVPTHGYVSNLKVNCKLRYESRMYFANISSWITYDSCVINSIIGWIMDMTMYP